MPDSRPRIELPNIGQTLSEKYLLESKLGEGAMGVVFAATHVRLGQRVAIKTMQARLLERADVVRRFDREARAAAKLKSPHAVRIFDVDEARNGTPYMVMELLAGHCLQTELKTRGALPIAEAVEYVSQACKAMAEAHALGIVHRDLKPSNLFLAERAGARMIKVLDFGVSKVEGDATNSMTATDVTLGTPLYMSPEQARSSKDVDGRSDLWSLGVILYELLAGRPPFDGVNAIAVSAKIVADDPAPLESLRPDAPRALCAAIHRALEKDRTKRFADIASFARGDRTVREPRRRERDARASRDERVAEASVAPVGSGRRWSRGHRARCCGRGVRGAAEPHPKRQRTSPAASTSAAKKPAPPPAIVSIRPPVPPTLQRRPRRPHTIRRVSERIRRAPTHGLRDHSGASRVLRASTKRLEICIV